MASEILITEEPSSLSFQETLRTTWLDSHRSEGKTLFHTLTLKGHSQV